MRSVLLLMVLVPRRRGRVLAPAALLLLLWSLLALLGGVRRLRRLPVLLILEPFGELLAEIESEIVVEEVNTQSAPGCQILQSTASKDLLACDSTSQQMSKLALWFQTECQHKTAIHATMTHS